MTATPRAPVIMAFALTATAPAVAWERMFIDSGGVWTCAVAALTAVAVSAGTRRMGVPPAIVPALGLGGIVLLGSITAVPRSGFAVPSPASLATTVGWLPTMWNATLDLPVPTTSRGQPMLLAITITWLFAAIGTELLQRARLRAGALACSVTVFAAALLLGSPAATAPVLLASPLILASWFFLALSGTAEQRATAHTPGAPQALRHAMSESISRPGLLGLVAVCGLAVMLAALAPWTGGAAPALHRTPEFEPSDFTSPLSMVGPQMAADPPKQLFQVELHSSEPVDRISAARLDHYNGDTWESRGDYHPINGLTGAAIPESTWSTGASGTVEVIDSSGPWLPTAGVVTRIDVPEAQADRDAGNLVLPVGLSEGSRYDFEGHMVTDRNAMVAEASTPVAPEYLQMPEEVDVGTDPGLPAPCLVSDIVELARRWTDSVSSSGGTGEEQLAKASTIENQLRNGYGIDVERNSGHTLSDLCQVLGTGPGTKPEPAHSEQFAAAMALMLRGIGIPSRVVVGYSLGSAGDETPVVVTEHDVTAWVEASIGGGWLQFDPTPGESRSDDSESTAVTEKQPVPPPTTPPVVDEPPASTTTTTTTPPPLPSGGEGGGSGTPLAIGGAAATVLAALGALFSIALFKSLRRNRRRRAPGSSDAVLGAWLEALDVLRDRGFVPRAQRTSRELVDDAASFTRRSALRSHLSELALLTDRALYSTSDPPEEQPQRAWQEFDAFEVSLNSETSFLQRLRARFRTSSLRQPTW